MPKNIPGTSSYAANVRCPTTGDAVNQAAWENGLTDLADRTTALNAGVLRVRSVATTVALRALTGMAVGDVAMVLGGGRLYQFQATEPNITLVGLSYPPYVYAANDATGFWFSAPPQAAMLVETQSVQHTDIAAIIGTYKAIDGAVDGTAFINLTDGVTPLSITLSEPSYEGDIIEVFAHFPSGGDGVNTALFRAAVTHDAVVYPVPGSGAYQGGTTDAIQKICAGRYELPGGVATSVVVTIQGRITASPGLVTVGDTSLFMSVKVYRATQGPLWGV